MALRLRKHADKSGDRTAGGSWPLAGISLELEKGPHILNTGQVEQGKAEGWISTTGDRVVYRGGGPAADPMNPQYLHTFVHYDTLTIHTLDGDVEFKVTHQPDKYADYEQASDPDAVEPFTATDKTKVTDEIYAAGATRVDHFYELKAV